MLKTMKDELQKLGREEKQKNHSDNETGGNLEASLGKEVEMACTS